MRWLLVGCYGLVFFNLSAAQLQITQKPRFYGTKVNHHVVIYCSSKQFLPDTVRWYKAKTYNEDPNKRKEVIGERISFGNINHIKNAFLYIQSVQVEDSGVYFCELHNKTGHGTQVIAARHVDLIQAQYRSTMKDVLMIFQGLLLAVCIAAVLLRRHTLLEKKDSIYEEPETDHIYEGLAIETCGGGLYEELTVYAEADVAEAPWE